MYCFTIAGEVGSKVVNFDFDETRIARVHMHTDVCKCEHDCTCICNQMCESEHDCTSVYVHRCARVSTIERVYMYTDVRESKQGCMSV